MRTSLGGDKDLRLEHALEAKPVLAVPKDFAARVAAKAAADGILPVRRATFVSSVGMRVAWAVAAVLFVAVCVMALAATGAAMRWLAYALEAEFVLLATWLSLPKRVVFWQ